MEFNEYQKKAWKSAIYPDKGNNIIFPSLGLGGESGEVLEKVKKIIRDSDHKINPEKKEELKKELGDVFWYLAALATELGLELNDIVEYNISKINSRKERGMVHGSGDNR